MGDTQLVYIPMIDGLALSAQLIQKLLEQFETKFRLLGLLIVRLVDSQLIALAHHTSLFDRLLGHLLCGLPMLATGNLLWIRLDW